MTRKIIAALFLLVTNHCHAAMVSQSFDSVWSTDIWDYYGDVAAMQWHYIPYEPWNPLLGILQEVRVETHLVGERTLASEPVRLRFSFSTGLSPADYQFYGDAEIQGGRTTFNFDDVRVFDSSGALSNWADYSYYPPANYYFESRTVAAAHSIEARTTLTFVYRADIPEPGSTGLAIVGFAALTAATMRRRRAIRAV